MESIPLLDLEPEIQLLWDELNTAIQTVMRSGRFIMGPEVRDFEEIVSDYLGTKHAISMNSGTDALVLGLRALGVGPGDEVITTPFTFFATAEAVSMLRAVPVFVDIDPETFNIDAALIEAHITDRTKVLLPVHLYGQAADMSAIMALAEKHNLKVLEDTAQAFGGSYNGNKLGTIGHAGTYSFFPSKNLGAFGDAGLLVTADDDIAEMARMLRTHGGKNKYHNEVIGYNSRMDSLQAAVLNVKLRYIDDFNLKRREAAGRYNELLADNPSIVRPVEKSSASHVYHQYTIRVTGGLRDAVRQHLRSAGISSMVYYPIPIHQLPVYSNLNINLPQSETASQEVLSLPFWPLITEETQKRVAAEIAKVIA